LAKKNNTNPDEIDLTTFQWVSAGSLEKPSPGCGGCHPGGGGLEFDRDGMRYDQRLKANPELKDTFDGDYYKSNWDKTGVVEADCLICHLPGYNFKARSKQLKLWNFKWATVAASGIGLVEGFVKEDNQIKTTYNKRLFNDDGKIVLNITYPPPSENCVFCHGLSDRKKRGFSWNDRLNHDIHNMRNLRCSHCHPGDLEHNFAKGDENISSLRDDLDNTMRNCKKCHFERYMGAPRPEHRNIWPDHLEKMACEVCHIPEINVAAAEGFDVSSGKVVPYSKIGSQKIGERFRWQPRYQTDEEGKLWPVNTILSVIYTNLDSDGIYYPLFAREIKKGYLKIEARLQDKKPDRPEIHTPEEIKLMLTALEESLEGNKRFKQIRVHYHLFGDIYFLDDQGQVVQKKDHTWAGHAEGFNINHNVAPPSLALGANGCRDCHSQDSHLFTGLIPMKLFGDIGEPEYTTSGKLIGSSAGIFSASLLYQSYLYPYILIGALILITFLIMHYTGHGPHYTGSPEDPADILRFPLIDRWAHLARMFSFLLLSFTGLIIFYKKASFAEALFGSAQKVIIFHWVMGIVFIAASLVNMIRWAKHLKFVSYDRKWIKKLGGYLWKVPGHLQAGCFNAGQKMMLWISGILTLMVGITGIMLIFKTDLSLNLRFITTIIHGSFGIMFMAVVAVHAYLGTIANPGSWRSMADGKVTRKWAEKHHSEWYSEIVK
jgi:formate dehydrogenase gamma subunit